MIYLSENNEVRHSIRKVALIYLPMIYNLAWWRYYFSLPYFYRIPEFGPLKFILSHEKFSCDKVYSWFIPETTYGACLIFSYFVISKSKSFGYIRLIQEAKYGSLNLFFTFFPLTDSLVMVVEQMVVK